ncbi:MAG: hypothetical protein U9O55_01490 [Patescibacteria group bacterium]|nr:hypothetical protein [Patescibacteria group bacterium]
MDKGNLIEQCYQKSIELLLKNSNEFGLMASFPNKKSKESLYTNIFGRDESISLLGIVIRLNNFMLK